MSSKPLWVRWFPTDFRGSPRVGRMTRDERYLYRELLDLQAVDGAFEVDPDRLAWDLRMTPDEFEAAWEAIRDCFEQDETGRFRNVRMEAERDRVFSAVESARANGRKGGRPPKAQGGRSKKPGGSVSETGRVTGSKASREPRTENRDSENKNTAPPAPVAPAPASPKARKPRKQATGPHAELVRGWEALWLDHRGSPWKITKRDAAHFARILKLADGSVTEALTRAERLLGSSDPWLTANASPAILESRWNPLGVQELHDGSLALTSREVAERRQDRDLDRVVRELNEQERAAENGLPEGEQRRLLG